MPPTDIPRPRIQELGVGSIDGLRSIHVTRERCEMPLDYEALACAGLLVDPHYYRCLGARECSANAQMIGSRSMLRKLGVIDATIPQAREFRRHAWDIKQQQEAQHARR